MNRHISGLTVAGSVYIATVIAAGLGSVLVSYFELLEDLPAAEWLLLAALTLFTGSFSIKVPSLSARISVSEAFVFAAVLSFGPSVATIIVALDALVVTVWLRADSRSPIRALFNIAAGSLAIWIAAQLFELSVNRITTPDRLETLLLPTLLLALSYFAINSWLIAIALAFERRVPAAELWRRNFLWLSLNYLGGASVALLVVTNTRELDVTALSVIVPLLIITYLTLRTSLGRLEDAIKHVAQLNDLYLSTVETLAMAVDAKDQITHGHIRRVQVYATELAKRLGVTDDQQLRAIEAAALLHDMGKLAIPEHILNKPGKLTPAEFDKMKKHADIGADLLSSIKFPYPVVPIVRHHHENWDGRGYPSGIAGTDIPIGARILSVVDCFDALNSDRPYRPRLSAEDSFEILLQRRGTMYDPLVVDTFIAAYSEISSKALKAGAEAKSILPTAHDAEHSADNSALQQIRTTASDTTLINEVSAAIARTQSLGHALDEVYRGIRQLSPATTCAIYRYDHSSDLLICEATAGDPQNLLRGLTIKPGERITGWCAANRRSSINSDASLDLFRIATLFSPPLKSALAIPIEDGDQLQGVFTAYSPREGAFNETHRYAAERLASTLGHRVTSFGKASRGVVAFPSKT